jgi:ubiquinone/menaquinone biosynthesis C-methylase UbiE
MSQQTFHDFEQAGWDDQTVCDTYHEHLGKVTLQATQPLLDAAAVGLGSRVLDVCTGPGYIAGQAAQRGAEVTGLDFARVQLELARQYYPAVSFQQGDAQALPFANATFDAVINGFGMCHFADPAAAIGEAFRVLTTGGRFAFTVWDYPHNAIGFGAVYDAIRTHGSLDIGLPAGPNFFLFSDPAQCAKSLQQAGFAAVKVSIVPQVWRLRSTEELFAAFLNGSVRAAATLKGQNDEALAAIRRNMEETLGAYARDRGYEIPMPAVLAMAIKP